MPWPLYPHERALVPIIEKAGYGEKEISCPHCGLIPRLSSP